MLNITFDSTKEEINNRLKNPFWGSFILSWIGWNWRVWYVTLFVNEEKVGNKIEYIKCMYNYFNFYGLFPFLGFLFNWIFMPSFIAFLIIWYLPKLSNEFLKKQRDNKIKENSILSEEFESEAKKFESEAKSIEQETIVLNKKGALNQAKQTLELMEKDREIKNIKKLNEEKELKIKNLTKALEEEKRKTIKSKTQEEIWDEELNNLKSEDKIKLKTLHTIIYAKDGKYRDFNSKYISELDLAFFDLNSLVKFSEKNNHYLILTEKGKYFLQKYNSIIPS